MKKTATFFLLATFILVFGCKNSNSTVNNSDLNKTDEDYISLGNEIASKVFVALSGELSNAVKKGGLSHAIVYCNTNAIPLTDSLSSVYNVDIKRTSLQYRNPKNKPTEEERRILSLYESAKKNGEAIQSMIENNNGTKTFYSPIVVQQACLKCHGNKSDIPIYKNIENLYPDDLAIGYSAGDLRGMWSIKFKPTSK